jgi:cobalamin biosynthetic protein CobC
MNSFTIAGKKSKETEFNHGGKLEQIKISYPQQQLEWIDLSTGISPFSYPTDSMNIELKCLPQNHNLLIEAAYKYYGSEHLTVIPGSMWAIQMLPVLRKLSVNDARPVLLPKQGFNEHEKAWRGQGYEIETYDDHPTHQQLNNSQACIIINPNNPTGILTKADMLKNMLDILSLNNAWLIIDEAFIDPYQITDLDKYSMSHEVHRDGLIVLRSFGKFFGLAGLRLGAILASESIQSQVSLILNNWSINNTAQALGIRAWLDNVWQSETNEKLALCGERLKLLFNGLNYKTVGTVYFQTLYIKNAKAFYETLLSSGIYTRLLDNEDGIRFGLPSSESQWQRLKQNLITISLNKPI